jgi:hypothetical protein
MMAPGDTICNGPLPLRNGGCAPPGGHGLSHALLCHHFRGKDALFWAVLECVSARVGQQLLEAERDAPDEVAALLPVR